MNNSATELCISDDWAGGSSFIINDTCTIDIPFSLDASADNQVVDSVHDAWRLMTCLVGVESLGAFQAARLRSHEPWTILLEFSH